MKLYFAPLQGYTTATYRRLHHAIWGGIESYYTPFVRIEKNEFRRKDLNDIAPENNIDTPVVPQMLPSNADELRQTAELFLKNGYTQADINMGCPFPPIALHRRGSGILPYIDIVSEILTATAEFPELKFSVKMRLGWQSSTDWTHLIDILNSTPLQHITMHPRIGKAQYKGCVDMEQFTAFYEQCQHATIYNGDLNTIQDINNIHKQFPRLAGVMLGRGLLARPYLPTLLDGDTANIFAIINETKIFHDKLYNELAATSQGDSQLLNRAQALWEYFLPQTPRKERKAIVKATSSAQYLKSVDRLFTAWESESSNSNVIF